mmetsp:Transcript_30520/g.67658  ORF Transcript_30520/g.67658 Transcript_30520/m.67658 type:complete len:207 (+) Transcript_30520:876-1496(+)
MKMTTATTTKKKRTLQRRSCRCRTNLLPNRIVGVAIPRGEVCGISICPHRQLRRRSIISRGSIIIQVDDLHRRQQQQQQRPLIGSIRMNCTKIRPLYGSVPFSTSRYSVPDVCSTVEPTGQVVQVVAHMTTVSPVPSRLTRTRGAYCRWCSIPLLPVAFPAPRRQRQQQQHPQRRQLTRRTCGGANRASDSTASGPNTAARSSARR